MLQQDFLRDAAALLSEHDIAVRLVVHFRVQIGGFRGRHVDLSPRIFLQKVLVIDVGRHIQVFPVIHPGPFQRFLIQLEAQRLNEVQATAGGNTGAADIAGIGRNLRLK